MATDATFSSILNEIQVSNLNFKIELTPFSAVITLKKTAIKNSKGSSLTPSVPSLILLQKVQQENLELYRKICNLNFQIENIKLEKKVASGDFEKTIDKLTQTLELSKVKSLYTFFTNVTVELSFSNFS